MPAFNSERFVAEAVASVQQQVHSRLEIIVINDGSSDATGKIVRGIAATDPRVRLIDQANSGPNAARNVGLRLATGDFVCFLDADDTLHPVKISRQLATLERTGDGLAFCDYYTADEELVPRSVSLTMRYQVPITDQLPLRNVFPIHAALLRREVVERVGTLDEELTHAEDWDFWIRCSRVTTMVHVPGALCSYRHHDSQSHWDRASMRHSQLRVVRKNFSPGTRERRLALAAYHWGEAKFQYSRGHRVRTLEQVSRMIMLARTPRLIRNVMRIGSYG